MFRHLNIIWVRLLRLTMDHSAKAACADAIASSTSSFVQQGTSAITSPVLESVTGIHRSVFESFHSPYAQYFFRITSPIEIPSVPFSSP